MQVGLDLGHIVLGGDPAPLPKRATAPNFGPCVLLPNGWMDQDATWYGGRPRPRPHYVRWGPVPPRKGHSSPSVQPMSIAAKRSPAMSAAAAHLSVYVLLGTGVIKDAVPLGSESVSGSRED